MAFQMTGEIGLDLDLDLRKDEQICPGYRFPWLSIVIHQGGSDAVFI